jgi:hypothetical protein
MLTWNMFVYELFCRIMEPRLTWSTKYELLGTDVLDHLISRSRRIVLLSSVYW